MIEMLGVGVQAGDGWLLRQVCTRLEGCRLIAVISAREAERHAFLDVAAGRRVPEEGRAWVNGVPVMAGTAGRLRRVVGEADLHARLVETRSVLWNLLATRRPRLQALGGILRLPRPAERGRALGALARVGLEAAALAPVASLDAVGKARLLVAAALERQPEWLVVRDPDVALGRPDAENLLAWLDRLTARERLTVLVSLGGALPTLGHVEHWLLLCGGRLAFDGPPAAFRTGRLSTAVHGNVHSLSE